MADIDFYGYERAKVGTFIYSSDYASVYFSNSGSGNQARKAGLVQSAAVVYQHNVQPRFEGGSSELYWLSGQSFGTLQVARCVGDQGILEGVQHQRSPNNIRKGILGGVEFKVGRLGLEGISTRQDVIALSGCVLQSWGASFSVGGLEVQESMTIQTALVKRIARA